MRTLKKYLGNFYEKIEERLAWNVMDRYVIRTPRTNLQNPGQKKPTSKPKQVTIESLSVSKRFDIFKHCIHIVRLTIWQQLFLEF